ncbi:unnamed protein product [Heterobilharzia americana]|nr:unnamed protein product [Heterobilharzia americana]
MSEMKAVVKSTDMPESAQQLAVDTAAIAMEKHSIEKILQVISRKNSISNILAHGSVLVGKDFGSYVTHEVNNFIYFYLQNVAVLLFKAG